MCRVFVSRLYLSQKFEYLEKFQALFKILKMLKCPKDNINQ
jgi:hypothetical protein